MVGHVGVLKLSLARKPIRELLHAKKTVLGFKNLEIWLIGSEHPRLTFMIIFLVLSKKIKLMLN